MSTPFLQLATAGLVLAVLQVLAALPWLAAFDGRRFRTWITDPQVLTYLAGGTLAGAAALGWYLGYVSEPRRLQLYGRVYGSLLHMQLIIDFILLAPKVLLWIWPKGGAVAIAAYRESVRQPLFWLICIVGALLLIVSMVIPYFTFGEDYKLMKQVGFDLVMLLSGLFGLLVSSISVNEEIEGRTAVTVISKPISRRQFFIGKYLGVLLACWTITLLLGWVLTWALYIKPMFDPLDDVVDEIPIKMNQIVVPRATAIVPTSEGKTAAQGLGGWFGDTGAHHIGLFRVFGQVMVLLAFCTALATRVQFIVNLVICLLIFLIGNLSPIMVEVTKKAGADQNPAVQLVRFIAQLFNVLFPPLDYYDMGPAIVRDTPLDLISFVGFVGTVLIYTLIWTSIAIFIGLFLFEDRDLG